eukprot:PLAT5169.1.p1 GENE.PLAT5169.1~~PLAT5169.1.p1  ORF type:complete len:431 (-),score=201.96 PLAT5169.1:583-1875(-)
MLKRSGDVAAQLPRPAAAALQRWRSGLSPADAAAAAGLPVDGCRLDDVRSDADWLTVWNDGQLARRKADVRAGVTSTTLLALGVSRSALLFRGNPLPPLLAAATAAGGGAALVTSMDAGATDVPAYEQLAFWALKDTPFASPAHARRFYVAAAGGAQLLSATAGNPTSYIALPRRLKLRQADDVSAEQARALARAEQWMASHGSASSVHRCVALPLPPDADHAAACQLLASLRDAVPDLACYIEEDTLWAAAGSQRRAAVTAIADALDLNAADAVYVGDGLGQGGHSEALVDDMPCFIARDAAEMRMWGERALTQCSLSVPPAALRLLDSSVAVEHGASITVRSDEPGELVYDIDIGNIVPSFLTNSPDAAAAAAAAAAKPPSATPAAAARQREAAKSTEESEADAFSTWMAGEEDGDDADFIFDLDDDA